MLKQRREQGGPFGPTLPKNIAGRFNILGHLRTINEETNEILIKQMFQTGESLCFAVFRKVVVLEASNV
jgi:hypothetical protein